MTISGDDLAALFDRFSLAGVPGNGTGAQDRYLTFWAELHQLFKLLIDDETRQRAVTLGEIQRSRDKVISAAKAQFDRDLQEQVDTLKNSWWEEKERLEAKHDRQKIKLSELKQELKDVRQELKSSITTMADERKHWMSVNEHLRCLNQDLRQRIAEMARELGTRSATRAERYKRLTDGKWWAEDDLPLTDLDPLSRGEQLLIDHLQALDYPTEISRYNPIVIALRRMLGDPSQLEKVPEQNSTSYLDPKTYSMLRGPATVGHKLATVFQTHTEPFLFGYAPDLAISHRDSKQQNASTIHCVVEVKPHSTDKFDNDMCGQVYDYLMATVQAQPSRRFVVAILTSIILNVVFLYDASTGITTIYRPCSFADLIRYIRGVVLQQAGYAPPPSPFAADLGVPQQRLGQGRHTAVASFTVQEALQKELHSRADAPPGEFSTGLPTKARRHKQTRVVCHSSRISMTPEVMAVKRVVTDTWPVRLASSGATFDPATDDYTRVSDEINILLEVNRLGCHDNLPIILYHTIDYQELATTPVGRPVPNDLPMFEIRGVVLDVLDALVWLHSKNIVHRDVRWHNIVCIGTSSSECGVRGVLIDLGEAVDITDRSREHLFRGGYICCPLRLMQRQNQALDATHPRCDMYHPEPSDDLVAWLLLVKI
ncbi:hypothetical protein FN846DRAFT_887132 [Sphaerosporella brunnea]|uniref:Protein kinase domain-containing protein n=1 Tax=Sphaerosporella brunnea TaxID=1250544 RepID=A0A5J5F7F0_9PEZI|nr:hypothetical protein FN846DRAFT_887132 [Sphaerosporella brunnea]